ncbi:hypothetical protein LDENG_00195980 [Lucifuga dentata]|nr:hypothetical protein LDENG_00195980 [Lucifuga dentata]
MRNAVELRQQFCWIKQHFTHIFCCDNGCHAFILTHAGSSQAGCVQLDAPAWTAASRAASRIQQTHASHSSILTV